MAYLKDLNADQMTDLADRLTRISMALFEFRIRHDLDADEEKEIREDGELRLDTLANVLRGRAIAKVIDDTRVKAADLEDALDHAKATLDTIASVKNAMQVVADVVALAGALIRRDPQAIAKAAKPLIAKAATEGVH
jgi:hypothetical protein